jgi:heat-inducible transcriptional repressor
VGVKESAINERAQALLKGLVEQYIRDGQPVGSTTLARGSDLKLSSATIRNVLADLERMGLVKSPHTSAGRVPTVKGYRLFIDNLLTLKPLHEQEVRSLQENIDIELDTQGILSSASQLLSGITQMAGLVTLPVTAQTTIEHIEFFPLSDNRVLAILVFSKNDVQNRIIHTERNYSQEELQRISNCLNAEFTGIDIKQVRDNLVRQMREAKENMDQLMLQAIEMANQVFQKDSATQQDYVIAGETNLMNYHEMADIKRLRQLFEAFNEKQSILQLLDQSLQAPGVQIYIGNESGYEVFDECSVVTATYCADDQVIGALGVIGPTRMAYDRVIPIVDVTAKLLGHVFKLRNG